MKVAVAANTLAESATTTAVPYVDVHETHTGVVVLARRTGIHGEEAGVAGTEFSGLALSWPVVDDDQGPTSRPRPGAV
jgi:hypothetical protein